MSVSVLSLERALEQRIAAEPFGPVFSLMLDRREHGLELEYEPRAPAT